jgi:hypothetical protein
MLPNMEEIKLTWAIQTAMTRSYMPAEVLWDTSQRRRALKPIHDTRYKLR